MHSDDLIDVAGAQELLRDHGRDVARATVIRWAHLGLLGPMRRLGGAIILSRSAVEERARKSTEAPAAA